MKTVKYWIEPGGHMKGVNHARMAAIIRNAWATLESVCSIRFVQGENNKRSVRIWFRTASHIKRLGKRSTTPLGLWLYDYKGIVLNQDRDIGLENADRWVGENLILHEYGHSFRIPHSADMTSVANDNISAKWLNPTDVRWWQRKMGRPASTFWPRDKSIVGARVRAQTIAWENMRDRRNNETDDMAKRAALTVRVQAGLKRLIESVNEWRALKQGWKSVPMAG